MNNYPFFFFSTEVSAIVGFALVAEVGLLILD